MSKPPFSGRPTSIDYLFTSHEIQREGRPITQIARTTDHCTQASKVNIPALEPKLPNKRNLHSRSYNRYVSQRYVRLVRHLEDITKATSSGGGRDLGFILWTTAIGVSSDQLVGVVQDEDIVKLICETEIGLFRQRQIGNPLRDYVPMISWVERVIDAVTLCLSRLRLPSPPSPLRTATRELDQLRDAQNYYCRQQLKELQAAMAEGDETPSILGDLFRGLAEPFDPQDQLKLARTLSGSLMAAGTTLVWLIGRLAGDSVMQETAYTAIREVYGEETPDPHNTDRIAYIKALGLEAGRLYCPIRLGFPRETYTDTVVDGAKIPAGTFVIYNSFQISRDPSVYDRPDEFVPERWLEGRYGRTDTKDGPEKIGVPHLAHGTGRRMCMGVPSLYHSLISQLLF